MTMQVFKHSRSSPPREMDGRVDNTPWVCECDHPAADGLGECADCHRLVMSHSRHAGRPPVPVHPEKVTDVVPGEAFWDARDRRFYFVDANPTPDLDPTQRLIPLTVFGEGVQDYDRRHTLLVADDPRAAERFTGDPLCDGSQQPVARVLSEIAALGSCQTCNGCVSCPDGYAVDHLRRLERAS